MFQSTEYGKCSKSLVHHGTLQSGSSLPASHEVEYRIGKHAYAANLERMVQVNVKFRSERRIRPPLMRAGPPGEDASANRAARAPAAVWEVELAPGKWAECAADQQEVPERARASILFR